MTRCNPTRFSLWTCALLLALVLPAYSRAQTQSVDTSQTINIPNPSKKKPKHAKFMGQVLSVTPQMIQVRSRQNNAQILMFSYTAKLSEKMAKIRAQGGYHYGDNVEIIYAPGSDVAINIKGKPSKAR